MITVDMNWNSGQILEMKYFILSEIILSNVFKA